jgi:anti-anti-sigma regulatory factor
MPSPSCTVVYTGARPTVRLAGRADRLTINQLSGVLRGLRAVGVRHVVIDMTGALDCDGRLLAVLVRARNQLADVDGELKIAGVNLPQVLDALGAATLEEVFLVYDAVRRDNQPPVHRCPVQSPSRSAQCSPGLDGLLSMHRSLRHRSPRRLRDA